jgi:phosphohistidine phosphatase
MDIYLIRHSDAEGLSKGIRDSERKLSEEGIKKIKAAANYWKNFIPGFDYIISSPYIRAYETARLIAEVFKIDDNLHSDKRLSAGSRTEDVLDLANSYKCESIAFVGHQPDMSDHVSAMISNSGAFVEFKKAAIAKISFPGKVREGKGILEFLIPPGIL